MQQLNARPAKRKFTNRTLFCSVSGDMQQLCPGPAKMRFATWTLFCCIFYIKNMQQFYARPSTMTLADGAICCFVYYKTTCNDIMQYRPKWSYQIRAVFCFCPSIKPCSDFYARPAGMRFGNRFFCCSYLESTQQSYARRQNDVKTSNPRLPVSYKENTNHFRQN